MPARGRCKVCTACFVVYVHADAADHILGMSRDDVEAGWRQFLSNPTVYGTLGDDVFLGQGFGRGSLLKASNSF